MTSIRLPEGPAALALGHPGHELAILHFLERAQPLVLVLTDGSGRSGKSRLLTTSGILDRGGARRGGIYGDFSDQDVYRALLAGQAEVFQRLAEALASELASAEVQYVAGDASEGYNPTHDVWRMVVNAAVELVHARTGRRLGNYEFRLFGAQEQDADRPGAVVLRLEPDQLERKLETAQAYPELRLEVDAALSRQADRIMAEFPQLADRIEVFLRGMGPEAYRCEVLCPVPAGTILMPQDEQPFYEIYGRMLVERGVYREAILYDSHLRPIGESLQAAVAA